jgi:two-component system, NtrC family, response regulator GlrR
MIGQMPRDREPPPTRNESTPVEDSGAEELVHEGRFQLWIGEAGAPERAWAFDGDRFSIGSHASNELVLTDASVSRFHCEVRCDGDGVSIRDLGSRNGTTVDRVRVRDAFLRAGSIVQVGRTTLRFGKPPTPQPPALSEATSFGGLVGTSNAMRAAFALLERAAQSQATVLLEGETGTGKGEAALAIHNGGSRRGQPFVVVDCGAVPENLFESELFGHERGAFTGADAQRIGAFEAAAGGTVFLDEVGELPLDVQPKLLRALEERQVRRLGSTQMRPIDVRIVAATNRDLRAAVNDGSFRADLFYRLAVVRVRMPSLAERLNDLPRLVERLVDGLGATPEQRARLTAPQFLAGLRRHAWRGNVRELRNYVETCLVLDQPPPHAAEETAADLAAAAGVVGATVGALQDARARVVAHFERQYLTALMQQHQGKVGPAAETAGVSRVYLYRLLGKYGLSQ